MTPAAVSSIMPSIKDAYKDFLNSEYGMRAYNRFKRILYGPSDSLVECLDAEVLGKMPFAVGSQLNICDVGGGDGIRIRSILGYLHERFNLRFCLDFVEQSSVQIHAFECSDICEFAEVRKHETLFEKWRTGSAYDLVFLIHSIFAFEDSDSFDKVLKLANSKGTVVIVSNAEDSFLGGLKRILDADYSDRRFEISDVVQSLMRRGVHFAEKRFQTKWTLQGDDLQEGIGSILDWLSLGRYQDLSSGVKQNVQRYIEEKSSTAADGLSFSEEEVVLVISEHDGPSAVSPKSLFSQSAK